MQEETQENRIANEAFRNKAQKEKLAIIDVREEEEYEKGHVPGAVNMPLSTLGVTVARLNPEQTYYVICQGGGRSQMACEFLTLQAIQSINVMGGTVAWAGDLEAGMNEGSNKA